MKRHKRDRVVVRAKVKVSLAGWELGDWPDYLQRAFVPKATRDEVSIAFSYPAFERASKKIAQEAIESFFEDGVYFVGTARGLEIRSDDRGERCVATIPWDAMQVRFEETAMVAAKAWIDSEVKVFEEENAP